MIRTMLLLTLLIAGCKDSGTNVKQLFSPLTLQDSIRIAVFQYQFEHNASGQQQTAKVYFMSVMILNDSTGYWEDGDPGRQILHYFDGNIPPVKPFSKCIYSNGGLIDRETGERGLLFMVNAIRLISNDQVEVDGGYYEGNLSSSGDTYYLSFIDGKWIVTKDIMHWIS
jgi:hypothetical protein